jgi:sec-independent protein translocase protein TatB
MIEINFWKIFLVLLVALVVLGPERLPKIARQLGRWIAQLRFFVTNTQKEFLQNSSEISTDQSDHQAEVKTPERQVPLSTTQTLAADASSQQEPEKQGEVQSSIESLLSTKNTASCHKISDP